MKLAVVRCAERQTWTCSGWMRPLGRTLACHGANDRLDIGLLKRSFLGWLRGEKKHTMVASPTLQEEDAKRPIREREQLVGKRTGIINRMKAALVRLGIR